MAQAKIYKCDNCEDVISDEAQDIRQSYLNLKIGGDCGWVVPGTKEGVWKNKQNIDRGRYDFCSAECLTKFAVKLSPDG